MITLGNRMAARKTSLAIGVADVKTGAKPISLSIKQATERPRDRLRTRRRDCGSPRKRIANTAGSWRTTGLHSASPHHKSVKPDQSLRFSQNRTVRRLAAHYSPFRSTIGPRSSYEPICSAPSITGQEDRGRRVSVDIITAYGGYRENQQA